MVSISRGKVALARDRKRYLEISLDLHSGDIALLVGPNGSGKTTLLDVVAGVRLLDHGKIKNTLPLKPIAYAVQDSSSGLLPWLTISQNILLPSRLHDNVKDDLLRQSTRLIEKFRLANRANDFPYKLSGGEKQAINLIRTLCTPCCLALLDEVLASLHHDLRALVKDELAAWLGGKTAILVTHDIDDLDLPFTRFFAINDGTLHEVSRNDVGNILQS